MAIYLHGEVQPQKKKPPFCNARALMTREIMRSKDAQCNTGELPSIVHCAIKQLDYELEISIA